MFGSKRERDHEVRIGEKYKINLFTNLELGELALVAERPVLQGQKHLIYSDEVLLERTRWHSPQFFQQRHF
jgi:hypothetical protein